MGTSIQHLTLSRMEPFKHSCSVLLLLALIIFVAGIEEGDVDGSLGYGRTFRGLPGLNYLDNVQNVEPEECCGACKKKAPDTEVFTVSLYNFQCCLYVSQCLSVRPSASLSILIRKGYFQNLTLQY